MKSNKDKIISKLGQKYKFNQQNWTTYDNFVQMYNHIIEELVNTGVAERLDEPVCMDSKGNPCHEEEAHGCKVHHRIIRLDLGFYSDEVGGNISMKGVGDNGGEKLVGGRGTILQQKTSTRNLNFTMIDLTSFDGGHVMCSGEETPKWINIEAGIDITVHIDGTTTDSTSL